MSFILFTTCVLADCRYDEYLEFQQKIRRRFKKVCKTECAKRRNSGFCEKELSLLPLEHTNFRLLTKTFWYILHWHEWEIPWSKTSDTNWTRWAWYFAGPQSMTFGSPYHVWSCAWTVRGQQVKKIREKILHRKVLTGYYGVPKKLDLSLGYIWLHWHIKQKDSMAKGLGNQFKTWCIRLMVPGIPLRTPYSTSLNTYWQRYWNCSDVHNACLFKTGSWRFRWFNRFSNLWAIDFQ